MNEGVKQLSVEKGNTNKTTQGPILLSWVVSAWTSNHMPIKARDEII